MGHRRQTNQEKEAFNTREFEPSNHVCIYFYPDFREITEFNRDVYVSSLNLKPPAPTTITDLFNCVARGM